MQAVELDIPAINRMLGRACAPALEELGSAEQAAVEASLSVPVERDFSGRVVQRSEPGEPPRTEDGILRAHIEHAIVAGPDGIPRLELTAERPAEEAGDDPDAATILEFGGPADHGYVMPRPFMEPARQRMEGRAVEVMASHFREQLT